VYIKNENDVYVIVGIHAGVDLVEADGSFPNFIEDEYYLASAIT